MHGEENIVTKINQLTERDIMTDTNETTGVGTWLMLALMFVVAFFIALIFTALSVGAMNAWIMEGTFSDGWSAAWDRWFITILWALLFSGGGVASRRRW